MEWDDPVSLSNVSDCCLGALGKVSDEGAYCAKGSPCAREIVGIEVCIDGGGGEVGVRVGEVLN